MAPTYHAPFSHCRSCSCPDFEQSATGDPCDLCDHHPAWHLPPLTLSPEQVHAAVAADGAALEWCKQVGCACPVWLEPSGVEEEARQSCELCGHRRGWHKARSVGSGAEAAATVSAPVTNTRLESYLLSASPPTSSPSSPAASPPPSPPSRSATAASPTPASSTPPTSLGSPTLNPAKASGSRATEIEYGVRVGDPVAKASVTDTFPTAATASASPLHQTALPTALAEPSARASEVSRLSAPATVADALERMRQEEEAAFAAADREDGPEIDYHPRSSLPSDPSVPMGSDNADGAAEFETSALTATKAQSGTTVTQAAAAATTEAFGTVVRTEAYKWTRDGATKNPQPAPSSQPAQGAKPGSSPLPTKENAGGPRTPNVLDELAGILRGRVPPPRPAGSNLRPTKAPHPVPPVSVPLDWHKVDVPPAAKLDLWVSPPPSARHPLRPADKIHFRLRPHSAAKTPATLAVGFVGNSTVSSGEHRDSHNFLALVKSCMPTRSPGIELNARSGEYEGSVTVLKTTNCACGGGLSEGQGRWQNKALPGSFKAGQAVVSYHFEVRVMREGRFGGRKEIIVPVVYPFENATTPAPGPSDVDPRPVIGPDDELVVAHAALGSSGDPPRRFLGHLVDPVELAYKLNPPPPLASSSTSRRPDRTVSWRISVPFPTSTPKPNTLEPMADLVQPTLAQRIIVRSSPGPRGSGMGAEYAPLKATWLVNCGAVPFRTLGKPVPAGWRGQARERTDSLTGQTAWVWQGGLEVASLKEVRTVEVCNLSVTYHLSLKLAPLQGFSGLIEVVSPAIDFATAPRRPLSPARGGIRPRTGPDAAAAGPSRPSGLQEAAAMIAAAARGHGPTTGPRMNRAGDAWEEPPPAFSEVMEDRRRLGEAETLVEEEGEAPPSWDEAVLGDEVGEWRVAQVVLGEAERQ